MDDLVERGGLAAGERDDLWIRRSRTGQRARRAAQTPCGGSRTRARRPRRAGRLRPPRAAARRTSRTCRYPNCRPVRAGAGSRSPRRSPRAGLPRSGTSPTPARAARRRRPISRWTRPSPASSVGCLGEGVSRFDGRGSASLRAANYGGSLRILPDDLPPLLVLGSNGESIGLHVWRQQWRLGLSHRRHRWDRGRGRR